MADMKIDDSTISGPMLQEVKIEKGVNKTPKVSGGAGSDGKLYMNTDNINSVPMGGSHQRGKQ